MCWTVIQLDLISVLQQCRKSVTYAVSVSLTNYTYSFFIIFVYWHIFFVGVF